jgi:hypothetical protein
VLRLGLADRRTGRLTEYLGQRPVLVGEVLDRAGRPRAVQDLPGGGDIAREISAVPSARRPATGPATTRRP